MASTSKKAPTASKRTNKLASVTGGGRAKAAAIKGAKRSATNVAIATELAPAIAIALLDKIEQPAGASAPSLECLAAGATPSETEGKVRLQLMFENGAVLPVEMSNAAGAALSKGLAAELPKK